MYRTNFVSSGRSTVFRAMFSHDMTESSGNRNRVVINDFDFKTMQELLRYIYCEEVLNLKEVALDLLQAADKVNKISNLFVNAYSDV